MAYRGEVGPAGRCMHARGARALEEHRQGLRRVVQGEWRGLRFTLVRMRPRSGNGRREGRDWPKLK
jgi:hypothetical protein